MAGRIFGIEALDEALDEVAHEANYYLTHGGPGVRDRFLDELVRTVQRIMEAPRSFPEWPRRRGVRRAFLARFPFAVGFVVGPPGSDSPPLVVVVAHGKRRPGYWFVRATKGLAKRRRRPGTTR